MLFFISSLSGAKNKPFRYFLILSLEYPIKYAEPDFYLRHILFLKSFSDIISFAISNTPFTSKKTPYFSSGSLRPGIAGGFLNIHFDNLVFRTSFFGTNLPAGRGTVWRYGSSPEKNCCENTREIHGCSAGQETDGKGNEETSPGLSERQTH